MAAGSGVAVTCLAFAVRIGCLKVPVSTVAATEAIAIGEADELSLAERFLGQL